MYRIKLMIAMCFLAFWNPKELTIVFMDYMAKDEDSPFGWYSCKFIEDFKSKIQEKYYAANSQRKKDKICNGEKVR